MTFNFTNMGIIAATLALVSPMACKPVDPDLQANSGVLSQYPGVDAYMQKFCIGKDMNKIVAEQPMFKLEELKKVCLTLAQGKTNIEPATNTNNNSKSFGLSGGVWGGVGNKVVQKLNDATKKQPDGKTYLKHGHGIGFSISPVPFVKFGVEGIFFDSPNADSDDSFLAIYVYPGFQTPSAAPDVFAIKTFGCKKPSDYTGGFLTFSAISLGVDYINLPLDIYKEFSGGDRNSRVSPNQSVEQLIQGMAQLYLEFRNSGELARQFPGRETILNSTVVKLFGLVTPDSPQLKAELSQSGLSEKNDQRSGVSANLYTQFTGWSRDFSFLGPAIDLLINLANKDKVKYSGILRILDVINSNVGRCDSLSTSLLSFPSLSAAVTWYFNPANISLKELKILTTGIGFEKAVRTSKSSNTGQGQSVSLTGNTGRGGGQASPPPPTELIKFFYYLKNMESIHAQLDKEHPQTKVWMP